MLRKLVALPFPIPQTQIAKAGLFGALVFLTSWMVGPLRLVQLRMARSR